jgi:polysaccharide pyruvyl transferase WcaK-like protein
LLVSVSAYSRYSKYNDDKSSEEYYENWVEHIVELINQKKDVRLFYTTTEDLRVVKMLQIMIKEEHHVDVPIVDVKSLDDLVYEISKSDEVISPRMHALILARLHNCTVRPVYISNKITSFSQHYLRENSSLSKIQEKIIEDLNRAVW